MNEHLHKYTNIRLEKPTTWEYNLFFTYNDYNYYLKLRHVEDTYMPSGRVVHFDNNGKHCPLCEQKDRDDCVRLGKVAEELFLELKQHPAIQDALASL